MAYHLACRIQAGCRWVLVDATWDPPLEKAGFPVNGHGDGYSGTKCAVTPFQAPVRTAFCRTLAGEPCRGPGGGDLPPPDGEKNHWEADDRQCYYREMRGSRTLMDRERSALFCHKLDAWLEQVRNPGYPGERV